MFTKPFRIKSNTATKGSERKWLRRRVLECYEHLLQPDVLLLIPNKCLLTSVKLVTHSGEEVVLYVVDGEPRLFQHEDRVFPTVYSLWMLSTFLQHVSTWEQVLTKLQGGADLMLPGIVSPTYGGHSVEGVTRGQVVAVELAENRHLVGVAVALMKHDEMLASGMRGKGFKMLHVLGDQLWAMGSKSTPLVPCMVDVQVLADTQDAIEQICLDGDAKVGLEEGEDADTRIKSQKDAADGQSVGDCSVKSCCAKESCENISTLLVPHTEVQRKDTLEVDLGLVPAPPDSATASMDSLLIECFLQALKTKITKDDIPLLTSTFYRSHMLDLCPPDLKLELKQTSYKKLSKFLLEMQKRGIVEVKELSKGVEHITRVDFKHPQLKTFSAHYLIGDRTDDASSSVSVPNKTLKVSDMFMPSHKLLPLFSVRGYGKSSVLDISGVRDVVTSYVKNEGLVSSSNPKMVELDPVLTDAFYHKGETPHTQLTWQQLILCVCDEMRPAYRIYDKGGASHIRKGKLEPVKLTVALRTGNKKVTLVDNLEMYFISPTELAHTIQRVVAASSTVNAVAGKSNGQQVLVQGNATKAITKLLEEDYGLPTRCIELTDKIKPSKKKGTK